AREDRGTERSQASDVVTQLEQTAASRTLQTIGKRISRAALDAREALGKRVGRHGSDRGASGLDALAKLPKRSFTVASISSIRWRSVCSASARRRAFWPIARASSRCAR